MAIVRDRILLFIPMYNCENQIGRVLNQLNEAICPYLAEVIIVNNRSTDKGEEAVKQFFINHRLPVQVSLLRNDENYGLGGSHKVAFKYAAERDFDYIIVLHGDDQGCIEDLLPYLKNKKYREYDCFLGARFIKGSRLEGYSAFRTFGNRVYNMLFSIGTGQKIYDLGSGLNMYNVEVIKDGFYMKYKDNLMFNYCMILGSAYYKHKVGYFPIVWREDDQVSNVKMLSQAIIVLKLLFSYIVDKKKFVGTEHRDNVFAEYTAHVVIANRAGEHIQ